MLRAATCQAYSINYMALSIIQSIFVFIQVKQSTEPSPPIILFPASLNYLIFFLPSPRVCIMSVTLFYMANVLFFSVSLSLFYQEYKGFGTAPHFLISTRLLFQFFLSYPFYYSFSLVVEMHICKVKQMLSPNNAPLLPV